MNQILGQLFLNGTVDYEKLSDAKIERRRNGNGFAKIVELKVLAMDLGSPQMKTKVNVTIKVSLLNLNPKEENLTQFFALGE